MESSQPHDTAMSGYNPHVDSGHENSAGGYAPPAYDSGYVPYQPDNDDEDSPVETKPKKKSFMDDDDDFAAKTAAIKKAEKERKDREADDAFRKAAEADGKSTFFVV